MTKFKNEFDEIVARFSEPRTLEKNLVKCWVVFFVSYNVIKAISALVKVSFSVNGF
jgi:hypothetical protein